MMKTYVDKENGLPLEHVMYRAVEPGGIKEVERHHITYTLIEWVEPTALPTEVFSTPKAQAGTVGRDMTLEITRRFEKYGLYWTGPHLGSLQLARIHQSETFEGGLPGSNSVALIYTPDGKLTGDRDVQIIQKPSTGGLIEKSCFGSTPGDTIMVAGEPGTLCDLGEGGTELRVALNGTFVQIMGYTYEEMLLAAATLHKLN